MDYFFFTCMLDPVSVQICLAASGVSVAYLVVTRTEPLAPGTYHSRLLPALVTSYSAQGQRSSPKSM